MTKALTEADGLSWREKLPPIPTVPLSVREKLAQKASASVAQPNPTPEQNGTRPTKQPGKEETFVTSHRVFRYLHATSIMGKGFFCEKLFTKVQVSEHVL